jgi:photosystem II stability/assembly factor-like uncharacterized protein
MLRYVRLVSLSALAALVAFAGLPLQGQSAAVPIADEFEGLHFRSIGPATMSGRISDLAVLESNPAVFYVATAHGGVWKTTSNGTTFEPLLQDQGHMSTGDVEISQTNPDLVWVGSGESNNRQSTSWGDGVYKSTDGGETFTNMGLRESRHINDVVIHPEDNDIVLVAATGPLFGPGGERGIYKTTDGGQTWNAVLTVDEDTGANGLVISHADPSILFASTYQRRRTQCCMNGGGPGSGVWKSTDTGDTWTRLEGGLPTGPMGRIDVDVYRGTPNLVYALIEGEGGQGRGGGRGGGGELNPDNPTGLYRSDDGGQTWRHLTNTNPRPMYFSKVQIDPSNPDRVYMGGVGLHMSIDGGRTFATDAAQAIHDDVHAIWIDPANPNHIKIGNDGGLAMSYDMSQTWQFLPNLPVALFYHITYDMEMPYNVCGGLQDNYNWCGPSAVHFSRGIRNSDWYQVQGGDGFHAIPDPTDGRYIVTESQNGNMIRRNRTTGESAGIRPTPNNVSPEPPEGTPNYRYNWDAPMMFSPHDPGTLVVAANRVFRSTDRGDSWAAISPDLTTNADRSEITTMGLRDDQITIARNDGISNWPTLVSLAESPAAAGVYFTGSDDGVVSMSRDGGTTWTDITDRLPGFPEGAWVSEVVPSAHDGNRVYIAADAHRLNDYATYVWTSDDAGRTFRSLNGNLRDQVVRTMTEDPRNGDVIYLGTETGLFLTLDRGQSWRRLKANFPTVRVDEITIHPRDNAMLVGTHGRAAWILDHLEPIQEYAAAQAATADAYLFSIPPAFQWRQFDNQNDEFWGHQFFVGENPPDDAVIQLFLKQPVGAMELRISDANNRPVRTIAIPEDRNEAGIQTVCWDLRVEPIETAGGGDGRGGRGGRGGGGRGAPPVPGVPSPQPSSGVDPANPCAGMGGGGAAGPWVLPGRYNVAFVAGGNVVDTKPMNVVLDPKFTLTAAQRREYFDLVIGLHEMQRRGTSAAVAVDELNTQMTDLAEKVPAMSNVPEAVKAQFQTVNAELETVREKFGVPLGQGGGGRGGRGGRGGGGGGGNDANVLGRLASAKNSIMSFYEPPSQTLVRQAEAARRELPAAIDEANALLSNARTLSQALAQHNVTLNVPAAGTGGIR